LDRNHSDRNHLDRILVCSGLCMAQGDTRLDLELAAGEFVALREVPDRHESDVLLAAATLRRPATGRLAICGQAAEFHRHHQLLPLRSRIGYVGPSSALVSDLSLRDNLLLGHRYFGREEEATARVLDLARTMRLGPLLDVKPALLPFECQRVAIFVRELAKEPRLIILDQPCLGLSEQASRLICRLLAEEKARGVACLLRAEAPFLSLADRVLLLEAGQPARELSVEAGGRAPAGASASG